MQKIEDGGPSKRPSASVRRLDFLKIKICTNLTQDLVGLPALSRLGKCQRVRELALRPAADSSPWKESKRTVYMMSKRGSTTGEVVCLSLPSIRSWESNNAAIRINPSPCEPTRTWQGPTLQFQWYRRPRTREGEAATKSMRSPNAY